MDVGLMYSGREDDLGRIDSLTATFALTFAYGVQFGRALLMVGPQAELGYPRASVERLGRWRHVGESRRSGQHARPRCASTFVSDAVSACPWPSMPAGGRLYQSHVR